MYEEGWGVRGGGWCMWTSACGEGGLGSSSCGFASCVCV